MAGAMRQRLIPLAGGRNFRDLGGYATEDGRHVKWGLLFRSGSMVDLTEADHGALDRLGIATICDFRTPAERENEPTSWPGAIAEVYWANDEAHRAGDIADVIREGGGATAEAMRAAMIAIYRELPETQAPAYAEIFRRLLAGRAPLVFNCAAGKDRTGVGAALLLAALGVDHDAIVDDYLATNSACDLLGIMRARWATQDPTRSIAGVPEAALRPLFDADAAYLEAAFEAIDRRYGALDGYFDQVLGLDRDERLKLRELYTE